MGPKGWQRTFSQCQRKWDNMTPEDVYGPEEDGDEDEDGLADEIDDDDDDCVDDCSVRIGK